MDIGLNLILYGLVGSYCLFQGETVVATLAARFISGNTENA
jgi:hypothetical protein